tara:strand:- start:8772 stop:10874 length:2103 start_codon:yes stop_codon:yes gene_type:complete
MAFMEPSFDTDVENAENLGIRQLTQLQQEYPRFAVGVAMENLKQDLVAQERQRQMDNQPAPQSPDVITQTEQEVMGMLGGGGQQPPMPQQGMGISQLPADNMAMPMAAEGGIVGFAGKGPSLVEEPDPLTVEQQRKRYEMLKELEAKYMAEGNQEALNNVRRELKNYEDSMAAQPPKPTPENTLQMAGGGIVALQEGGLLGIDDYTESGERIVSFIFDEKTGAQVPVTEAEYEIYLESNILPPNRNANRTASSEEGIPAALDRPPTSEQILGERLGQVDDATGNAIIGEGGLFSDIGEIIESDDTWQRKVGRGAVAVGEAGLQGLLKTLGGVGAGTEYGVRSATEGVGGAAQQVDLKAGEQIEAAQQRITAQTQQALNALEEERNAISSNPDMFNTEEGKARLAEIGQEIENQKAGLQSRLDELANTPSPTDIFNNIPQDIANYVEQYNEDPRSTAIGNFLGGIQDQREEQKQAELNADITRSAQEAQNLAIQSQRGTLSDDDYMLGQIAKSIGRGQPNSQQPPPPPEGEGSSTATKRSGLDKILDIASLLGGAAGSSKGYEGQSILDKQRQERLLEEQQEFELAKQQQLLDQRTTERELIENQRLAIARAGEMADVNINEIMLDPAVRQKRKELIEEHDVFFGGYDEDAVERDLNAFILQLLQQRRQEIGALYDTMQSGGGTSSNLPPVPPDVTVTRSP